MPTYRPFRTMYRALFGIATAVAVAALVVAHIATGPGAHAAADDLLATGPGQGGSPHVRTFGPAGAHGGVDFLSAGTTTSGASVAIGDVTGDGVADIVTGSGQGAPATVQVWSRDGKTILASAPAFNNFSGGVNVATAAIDGAAGNEVIVGAGPGGDPHVRVLRFSGGQLTELTGFYAYDVGFRGGAFVAGVPGAVITGAGAGGGPHVRVRGISPAGVVNVQSEWMALGAFTGGVRVAAGDVVGDAALEVIAGAGPGGGPIVRFFTFAGQSMPAMDFYAYAPNFAGGVWVGTAGAVRNPNDRLITGAGAGGSPHVRILSMAANGPTEVAGFLAYAPNFTGGVRVAGFPASSTGTTTTTSGGGSTTTGGGGSTTTTGGGGSTTTTAGGGTTTTTAACDGTLVGGVCLPVP